ncbi:MAG TPA: Ig-like domain-containing domain [Cyclobacteriaceae bacterium]|nr:Ig-like domain-containing protein [Cyclobacteriaceae bacterium]HMV07757.1 Ig-like domain-containing domain [Cyclobacteriaceae bacterium]HMV88025.1 Ig-like domain-containing domain [Cyclobacteriaceae bacterium]HMW98892.1 Ig-like domain-containing domain [Cyclobacteriaceae bacterium]HMX48475.1 Ig-like domain-containing domain [Cyclobacteriaceae bacterium]
MKFRLIYFLLLSFLALQCAKQTAPTGGPKDETPPKLRESFPKHEQINFKGDRIELSFDEPIQLNNPREQIIITPSVGKDFDVTFNKNRVTIQLKSRLQENTTYTINFREAVQDLTEKNPANAKIAFSTGDYLDSLQISGKVIDALTEVAPKSYTVALAEYSDTFNIFKHPGAWITQTDKTGKFSLENLKPGKYFLYAFNDKSKNLLVDSKSETYGFISQPITLEKNLDSLVIRTFKADMNRLKLMTARPTFAYFILRFSKSLTAYSITPVDSTKKVYASLEPDLTTVKLYNTFPNLDSMQIKVHATDSMNFAADSLIYMKFPKKEATKDKFTSGIEYAILTENNSLLTSQISFTKPIITFTPDSIYIKIDSVTNIPFSPTDFTWNYNRTKLSINKKADISVLFPKDTTSKEQATIKGPKSGPPTQPPQIAFTKAAFISAEGDTSISVSTPIKYVTLESTAIIEAEVKTTKNFVLQLVTKTGKVVAEVINQKKFSFENLNPETYLLRLIIDVNGNGKWDPGNYQSKTEPEPVVYYRNPKGVTEISLKANWTLGPLLITY